MTGDDVKMLRVVRLGWPSQDFARFLGVALSAAQRWESFGADEIRVDPQSRRTLKLIVDVLDTHDEAFDIIQAHRDADSLRALFVLLGLKYRDTPWRNDVRHKNVVPVSG